MQLHEATPTQRFFAFIIDMMFVGAFCVGLHFLISDGVFISEIKYLFTHFSFAQIITFLGNISTLNTLLYFLCYVLFHILYFIIIPMIFRGKTIGKMFLRIRIVKFDDTKPGYAHLFIREVVCYLILVFVTCGLILPISLLQLLFSRGHRSLGDRMSNLLVVKDPFYLKRGRLIIN